MDTIRTMFFIDSMLDTRLGAVRKLNNGLADQLLKEGYKTRLSNRLSNIVPTIDEIALKKIWDHRNSEVLKLSKLNEVFCTLAEKRKESELLGIEHPKAFSFDITLNIWPYKLNNFEIMDFKETLKQLLLANNVTIVSRNIATCSPIYFRENFDHVYMYDLSEWLNIHATNLDRNRMKDVVLTFPLCYLDDVDPNGKDPIALVDFLEMSFSKHFTVDVLPLKAFSTAE